MADVLCVNGAVFLANLFCQGKNERARTCRRVIDADILCAIGSDDFRDNLRNRMRRVIFGILAAVLVVVLDKILEDIRIEIILLLEYGSKTLRIELVDNRPAEIILTLYLCNQIGQRIKEAHAVLRTGSHREYILIDLGNMKQGVIEGGMETILTLAGKQAADKVFGVDACDTRV